MPIIALPLTAVLFVYPDTLLRRRKIAFDDDILFHSDPKRATYIKWLHRSNRYHRFTIRCLLRCSFFSGAKNRACSIRCRASPRTLFGSGRFLETDNKGPAGDVRVLPSLPYSFLLVFEYRFRRIHITGGGVLALTFLMCPKGFRLQLSFFLGDPRARPRGMRQMTS